MVSVIDIFFTENENSTDPTQKPHLSLPPAVDGEETRGEEMPLLPTTDRHTRPTGPLPPGWGEKVDLKTGRQYFEKYYGVHVVPLFKMRCISLDVYVNPLYIEVRQWGIYINIDDF